MKNLISDRNQTGPADSPARNPNLSIYVSYSHKDKVELPVWRAILADDQHTRLYISPTTAGYRIVDRDARSMRWLERGLHGMDFTGLRKRPLWDLVTLLLLAGVTTLCITGAWMAIQRVRRDLCRR